MAKSHDKRPDDAARDYVITEPSWCDRCGTPNNAKTPITYQRESNTFRSREARGAVLPVEITERQR